LLESTDRVGGWVSTLHCEDGSLFERGPRSIRGVSVASQNTLKLVGGCTCNWLLFGLVAHVVCSHL